MERGLVSVSRKYYLCAIISNYLCAIIHYYARMKKKIKIQFTDFHPGFQPRKNWIYLWLEAHDYEPELSDTPDYLVFSVFGEKHLRYTDCVKIFYTGECQTPDFNLCDYALGFDYMDFGDRYMRYPLYYTYNVNAFPLMEKKHLMSEEQIAAKKDFCAFVVSNGRGAEQRVAFFHALNAVRRVDSGGKLLNNIGAPVADKMAFQATHRFAIAFENTAYPGYTTEKIVEAFAAGCIPIYYGDPCVVRDFNPNSFINCADFASFDEVVKRVVEIDDNPDLLRQYLRTPALNDPHTPKRVHEQLDAFLENIFSQEKQDAMRYNRTYWGTRIVRERQRERKAYERSLYYRLCQFYMKTVYPIARRNKRLWYITEWLMRKTGNK